MSDFFKEIDGEGRFWLTIWLGVFATLAVVVVCACVHGTVTEVYNPNPNKWVRDAAPTIPARPAAEDK